MQQKSLFHTGVFTVKRHEVAATLKKGVQTGDLFFRLGDETYLGVIKFSKFTADLTGSEFSHAAIGFWHSDGEYYLAEVNERGCVVERLIDHLDYIATDRTAVWRLKDKKPEDEMKLQAAIADFIARDPDYDFKFDLEDDRYYCTESVVYIYAQAGFKLAKPETLKDLIPAWSYWLILPINFLFSLFSEKCLPMHSPVYVVGNEKHGIMSSPILEKAMEVIVKA